MWLVRKVDRGIILWLRRCCVDGVDARLQRRFFGCLWCGRREGRWVWRSEWQREWVLRMWFESRRRV
jgi:hypothetical protein